MVRISAELPEEVADALDRVAAEMQSTREALLLSAAESLLAGRTPPDPAVYEGWAREGKEDVAAGRAVPFEEAVARMDAIIARARAARG